MAAVSYIGRGTFVASTGSTSVSWPTHTTGDFGLLLIETARQPIATPSGWTAYDSSEWNDDPTNIFADTQLQVFYRFAESASESSVSLPDAGDHIAACIAVFRDVDANNPFDVTNVKNAAKTNSVSYGQITTVTNGSMVLLLCSSGRNATATNTWGTISGASITITERLDATDAAGNGGGLYLATGAMATAGATGTISVAQESTWEWASILTALRPQISGAGQGTLSGSAVVSGIGKANFLATGSVSGAAAFSASGITGYFGTGSAAGLATVSGVGSTTASLLRAVGAALFTGVGAATAEGVFASSGQAEVLGVGIKVGPAAAEIAGSAIITGIGVGIPRFAPWQVFGDLYSATDTDFTINISALPGLSVEEADAINGDWREIVQAMLLKLDDYQGNLNYLLRPLTTDIFVLENWNAKHRVFGQGCKRKFRVEFNVSFTPTDLAH